MRERTARIGSAGKSFSVTGWKVGYVTAAPETAEADRQDPPVHDASRRRPTCSGHGGWPQVGRRLFLSLAADMQRKRDRLADALPEIGFDVLPAHGTYFVTHRLPAAWLQRHRRGFLPPYHRRGGSDGGAGQRLL